MQRLRIQCRRIPAFLGLGLALILTGGLNVSEAAPRELIKNGGFEKALRKWSTRSSDRLDGRFFWDAVRSVSPLSFYSTAENRRGKKRYAIADQREDSYQILIQKFRIPRNARKVVLSYQMFAESRSSVVKNPDVFDLEGENQQARADLLRGDALAKDTGTGVVRRLFSRGATAVNPPKPARYKRYRFNITSNVTPGRSYQIRFAAISTETALLLGVDNVSVKVR